jgi:hypothetical protein
MIKERSDAFLFDAARFFDDEAIKLMDYAEKGMTMALLWHQWNNDSIPDDQSRCGRILASPISDDHWELLCELFSLVIDNRRLCPWLHERKQALTDYRESKREAGKRGAAAKWAGKSDVEKLAETLVENATPNGSAKEIDDTATNSDGSANGKTCHVFVYEDGMDLKENEDDKSSSNSSAPIRSEIKVKPFDAAKMVLSLLNQKLERNPPTQTEIKRYIREDSPLLDLLRIYKSPDAAVALYLHARKIWTHQVTWESLHKNHANVYEDMKGTRPKPQAGSDLEDMKRQFLGAAQ